MSHKPAAAATTLATYCLPHRNPATNGNAMPTTNNESGVRPRTEDHPNAHVPTAEATQLIPKTARTPQMSRKSRRRPFAAQRVRAATAVHINHRLKAGTPTAPIISPKESVRKSVAAQCPRVRFFVNDELIVNQRGERMKAIRGLKPCEKPRNGSEIRTRRTRYVLAVSTISAASSSLLPLRWSFARSSPSNFSFSNRNGVETRKFLSIDLCHEYLTIGRPDPKFRVTGNGGPWHPLVHIVYRV